MLRWAQFGTATIFSGRHPAAATVRMPVCELLGRTRNPGLTWTGKS